MIFPVTPSRLNCCAAWLNDWRVARLFTTCVLHAAQWLHTLLYFDLVHCDIAIRISNVAARKRSLPKIGIAVALPLAREVAVDASCCRRARDVLKGS